MKLITRSRFCLLAAMVIASALLGGCSSSSNNTGPNNGVAGYGGNVFPKTGTTYTYDLYQTDSNYVKVAGTDTTVIASVIASGLSYLGKSKVFVVSDNGANNFHTFESNGDLDISLDTARFGASTGSPFGSFGNFNIKQWFTFFTGSKIKGDLQVFSFDTSFSIQGVPIPVAIHVGASTGYLGEESVVVGSETLACSKVHLKLSITAEGLPFITNDQIYWFCPKIGYFAKEETRTSPISLLTFFSAPGSGTVQILTSYHLQP